MGAGAEEKTEQPTAKRRSDARKKGNIPRSRDLAAALQLLAAINVLKYIGPYMARHVLMFMTKIFEQDVPYLEIPERKELISFAIDCFRWIGYMLVPFLLLMALAAIIIGMLQVGFLITFEQLKLNLGKLNPIAGLKRLFTTRSLVVLAVNFGKLLIILPIAWATVYAEIQNVITMVEMEAAGTFLYMTSKTLGLAETLAYLLMALGILDFFHHKYTHNKGMKMTKQEVKEEFKQMEGDPQVKSKRRSKQMEMAMQRMMQEVPQAEVVVRNPTHYAIAISYKTGMRTPVVVAKGKNKMAEKIIEEAKLHRVPMVENPPLARELYKKVEVGQEIPEELFAAVAEILISVMSEEKKRTLMQSWAAA